MQENILELLMQDSPDRCWEPGGNWAKIDFTESVWECVNQLRKCARQYSQASHSATARLRSWGPWR